MDSEKDTIKEMLDIVRHNNRILQANRNAQLLKKLIILIVLVVVSLYSYNWYQKNKITIVNYVTKFKEVVEQSEKVLKQTKDIIGKGNEIIDKGNEIVRSISF